MKLREGDLEFDFNGALDAFKFDEQNRSMPRFHGLSHCMKAVDFIVEYKDYYLFVEIKNPTDTQRYRSSKDKSELVKALTVKFRDTFIYRWAENKLDKPVRYQCLVELDNAQVLFLMGQLKNQLPANKTPSRWSRKLIQLCAISNLKTWNKTYSGIQVKRV